MKRVGRSTYTSSEFGPFFLISVAATWYRSPHPANPGDSLPQGLPNTAFPFSPLPIELPDAQTKHPAQGPLLEQPLLYQSQIMGLPLGWESLPAPAPSCRAWMWGKYLALLGSCFPASSLPPRQPGSFLTISGGLSSGVDISRVTF